LAPSYSIASTELSGLVSLVTLPALSYSSSVLAEMPDGSSTLEVSRPLAS
jgi:hypothetical protein